MDTLSALINESIPLWNLMFIEEDKWIDLFSKFILTAS